MATRTRNAARLSVPNSSQGSHVRDPDYPREIPIYDGMSVRCGYAGTVGFPPDSAPVGASSRRIFNVLRSLVIRRAKILLEVLELDRREPGYRGFKDYTSRFLKMYDALVGFVAPHVWGVGEEHGLGLYRRHMGFRHLDVGPGTGFFIVETNPPQDIELTLLDASPHVLDFCAERLAAWNPTTIRANVLEPLPVDGPFDSAALAHVIHCLPGPMPEKARAIEHIAAVLTDDGVLFGGQCLDCRRSTHGRRSSSFAWSTFEGHSTTATTMLTGYGRSSRRPSKKSR